LLLGLIQIAPIQLPILPAQKLIAEPMPTLMASASISPPIIFVSARGPIALAAPATAAAPFPWLTLVAAVWLIGVFLGIVRVALGWRHCRCLCAGAAAAIDPILLSLRDRLCRQMAIAKSPAIALKDGIPGPVLIGIIHPIILLPATLAANHIDMILAHELAHLRRRDLWWRWLAELIGVLYFFHPLVYFLRRELSRAEEAACDSQALCATGKGPRDYGRLLLSLVASPARSPQPQMFAAGIVESAASLRNRLRLLAHAREMSRRAVIISSLCTVLIALAGLLPWRLVSKSFAADNTRPLLSASNLHGSVLAADGTPVSGATVFVALPGPSNLRIRNGRLEDDDSNTPRAVTGPDGKYDLPRQPGKFLLQVIADAGYGQADQDAVVKNSDIQLTAWGRIQGRLMIGTKPGAAIELQAGSLDQALANGPAQLSMCNRAQTDADGNFTMDRVIPGMVQVERNFAQQSGSNSMIFSGDIGTAQVIAGQTTTVNFGGIGRPVVGRFVFPPGMNPSDYFINARAIAVRANPTTPWQYFLEVDAQHNFRINNVIPGDYRIHVFMQKVRGDRTAQPKQVKFTMLDVPGGVSDVPLVIPDIQLQ
jgi:beta-lactamase regulating signal transducer with metallopeptidase domain